MTTLLSILNDIIEERKDEIKDAWEKHFGN